MIHSLVEMNCFAQECSVYGYMWKDRAGRIKYTTSADETVIQHSFEQKVLESYELSPIKIWTVREIIKEETKDDLWMYLKLVLCDKLKENFNADYFSILHDLISVAPDDQARDILLPWMEELDGYYDEASLQLFEGAVAIASVSKHLKPETYGMIKGWLQKTRRQIFSRMSVQDNYERTFGGFAYENGAGGVLQCKPKGNFRSAQGNGTAGNFSYAIVYEAILVSCCERVERCSRTISDGNEAADG